MNGVEILTSEQVATEWADNWTGFWIVFSVIVGILLIVGIISAIQQNSFGYIILTIMMGGLFGYMFGLLPLKLYQTPTAYETQYKVTVSDKVSMTEFYEHYEVIEQDGKIFTVREKTK